VSPLWKERLREQGRYDRIEKVEREEGIRPSRYMEWKAKCWTCPPPCGRDHVKSIGEYIAPPCRRCGSKEPKK
jgi:hypothetical protein